MSKIMVFTLDDLEKFIEKFGNKETKTITLTFDELSEFIKSNKKYDNGCIVHYYLT